MGEVGDPSSRSGEPAVKSHGRQDPNQIPGLHRKYAPDVDLVPGPEISEPQEDAEHGPGSTHDISVAGEEEGKEGTSQSADEVEPQEGFPTKLGLQPRSEKEEADHVHEQVHEPAMNEHVGKNTPGLDENRPGDQGQVPQVHSPRTGNEVYGYVRHQKAKDPRGHRIVLDLNGTGPGSALRNSEY